MAAQPPRTKMPPLTALRAFEAAGRLGGFAPAALELGVTPGAVTAHLKTLETSLGVALFERHPRGVSLTEVGARVLPDFTEAFAALGSAVHRLEVEATPGLVRIATTPDLAQLWLSPRLPALRRRGLQGVPVPVSGVEAAGGVADLALFFEASEEASAPLIAVAAPSMSDAGLGDLVPAECLILAGDLGDWGRFAPQVAPRGPVLRQAALALEEAAHGAGVLVIARPLAEAALKAGRVVQVLGAGVPSGQRLRLWPLRSVAEGSALAQALAALSPEP
ncbi:LysR family transcriptional regulator [Pararhodobacter sp.]|uniref:LysR family transcriptional regulator n=1 Tax=Pararhodobacter sp. TaxID=2127056 RepID=UPI002AFF0403|nr:LysR family transcriptional regulator [Pararhodobacter sp.]